MRLSFAVGAFVCLIANIAAGQPRIIDTHIHGNEPSVTDGFPPDAMCGVPTVKTTEELILGTMAEHDRNHVRWAVLSGNDAIIKDWKARYPDRIILSYMPPCGDEKWMKSDHTALAAQWGEEIDRNVWGALGELIHPYYKIRIDDEFMYPYYRVAQEKTRAGKNIPVFFHVGNPEHLNMDAYATPAMLKKVAQDFPDMIIVVCHMAAPAHRETLKLMVECPNVYAENSANNWGDPAEECWVALREAKELGVLNKLMYGSDQMRYPGLISQSIGVIRASGLTPEELNMVFWGNAARLLGITDDGQYARVAVVETSDDTVLSGEGSGRNETSPE